MRIIGGKAKGRKLCPPPRHEKTIRPTSDRAREALFSILGDKVRQAKVLDLFAGTGALGLEAFSRDAQLVVFVDNNSLALHLIKKNILHCLNNSERGGTLHVIQHDLTRKLPPHKLPGHTRAGFDLIFADPPYTQDFSLSILELVNNSSLLAENGLLIVEARHTVQLPASFNKLECVDRRVYGEAAFSFYQNCNAQ